MLSSKTFRGLLQRSDARRERLDLLVVRRLRGRHRGIFLRRLEGRIRAALRIARRRARGIDPLRQFGERSRRRFKRRHAAGQRLIRLRSRTRRGGGRFGLGDPRIEIVEPAHRLFGGADAGREIGERALVETGRLRTQRKIAHLQFQDREPRRERRR